jgi:septum formation protein
MKLGVVLASGSPRRHELLRQIGVPFATRVPDIDESPRTDEAPADYVRRIAQEKAAAVCPAAGELVFAADTTVDIDSVILAKPVDAADAVSMLRRLSGRAHLVHTGVAVHHAGRELCEVCTSSVEFIPLEESTIEWYVATGEPFGKAGAYAIQGAGAVLVSSVSGSVSNVIGLPLHLVVDLARRMGVDLLSLGSSDIHS